MFTATRRCCFVLWSSVINICILLSGTGYNLQKDDDAQKMSTILALSIGLLSSFYSILVFQDMQSPDRYLLSSRALTDPRPATIYFTHDHLFHIGSRNRLPPCFTVDASCPESINLHLQNPITGSFLRQVNITLLDPRQEGFRSLFEIEAEVMRHYRSFLLDFSPQVDPTQIRVDRMVCFDPARQLWQLAIAPARTTQD